MLAPLLLLAAMADEPMLVELVVEGLHREVLEVPASNGQPMLPVAHLLTILQIEHEAAGDRIVGHWADGDRPFVIAHDAIVERGRRTPLSADDTAELDGMTHVSIAALASAFGLRYRFEERSLRVTVRADPSLPAYRRRALRSAPRLGADGTTIEAVRVPRSLFDGHVLDWELWSSDLLQPDRYDQGQFRLFYGGEVLGGALSLAPYGTFAEPWNPQRSRAVWSWAVEKSALDRIDVGTIGGPGPWARPVLGLRVTNQPRERGLDFDDFGRIVTAPPNTFVRVWRDGQLIDAGETDGLGRRQVRLPASYGSNLLRVEYVDRFGELVSDETLLRVPSAALPEGRFEYDVGFGLDRNVDGRLVGGVETAYGILPQLTVRGGADVFIEDGVAQPFPYASAIVTPLDPLTLEVTAAPGAGYFANAALRTVGGVLLSVSHDEYDGERLPLLLERRTSLAISAPLVKLGLPISLRASARESTLASSLHSSELSAGAAIRWDVATFLADWDWRGDLRGGITDHTGARLRVVAPVPLIGGAASAGVAIDVQSPRVDELRVSYTRTLTGALPLHLRMSYATYDVGPGRATHEGNLILGFRWDAALTETRAYARSDGTPTVHARAAGSMTFDDDDIAASWQPQAERGRAEVRFVGSSQQERAGRTVVVGGRRYEADDDGRVFVPSLVRGRRYTIDASDPGIAAPNVVALEPRQTFVARAHRRHVVELPLVATGEIEGRVFTRRSDGSIRGIGRVRVRLIDESGTVVRSEWTYDDGAVYLFGVAPGRYVMRLDEQQLERLKWRAAPIEKVVVVEPILNGDVVRGVDFELAPRDALLTKVTR